MTTTRLAPRGGTIFWGTVLLLIATLAGVTAVFGSWSWLAVVWLVIAFGALMVVAAIIGGVARAVAPARGAAVPAAPATPVAPTAATPAPAAATPPAE